LTKKIKIIPFKSAVITLFNLNIMRYNDDLTIMGKTRGLNAGNKIKKNLQIHHMADIRYKRRKLHYIYHQSFEGAPLAKGIALEKMS